MILKTFRISLLIGAAIVLTYCSSQFYVPTQEQVYFAQQNWPEADSTYLINGYELYKNKCGNCHYLYKPSKFYYNEWNKLLPEMKLRAKLSEEEYQNIKTYVLTLSKSSSSN